MGPVILKRLRWSVLARRFGKAERFDTMSMEAKPGVAEEASAPADHVLLGSSTQRSLARQPGPGAYRLAAFGTERPTTNKLAQRGSDFGFGSR